MTEIPTNAPVTVPEVLPILPLRNTVVFPTAVVPIAVGQPRSVRLVEDVMNNGRLVGLFTMRGPDVEVPELRDLYSVGTASIIHQMLRSSDGSLRLVAQGLERIRLVDLVSTEPYLVAHVSTEPTAADGGLETEALVHALRDLFRRLATLVEQIPDELVDAAEQSQDPLHLAYLVAASAPLTTEVRQEILELSTINAKLRRLIELLQRETAIRELGQQIRAQTQEQLTRAQRQYYLREQLRAIQRELGEEEPQRSEVAELHERLEKADLPEEARREAERELSRLESVPLASPEYSIIRTYLDWLLSLPWNKITGGIVNVDEARRILDEDHYDIERVKDRIIEYLAVRELKQLRGAPPEVVARGPVLGFIGPPGVGKTSLGQSIARAMGRRFIRISLGGVHDEAEIRGHRRTYIGAMPGRIIQGIRRAESADPVFMLDEVDKLGVGFQGDPAAALLEVLDPAQNKSFVDAYLGVSFDLSRVVFICTANTTDTIPPALLDRIEVIRLAGYTDEEKLQIARRFLLPRQLQANGLKPGELEVTDAALRRVVHEYTREAGVRNLERELASICRKAAQRIVTGAATPIVVDAEQVPDYLGKPIYYPEVAERTERPGVATGLAWTPTGGAILFIEATMIPGHDERLILTGMLGDVMRESAQAALSYLRSNAQRFGINPSVFEGKTIHVHVPAGAIPKDGPSAGIAILAALASAASGRPVRSDVAMTGEITLRGAVLPVGGIKEKVLAARRADLRTVILPRRNERDLDDIPDEVRRDLTIVLVDWAGEVLDRVLCPEVGAVRAA